MAKTKRTASSPSQDGIDIFVLWKEYERIAMHFNDLIIRLRSQALGGVAVISALVSVLSKGNAQDEYRWGILSGAFVLLIVFWIAIWCLDFRYYNRLLLGAVKELKRLEEESKNDSWIKEINLSTAIDNAVCGRDLDHWPFELNSEDHWFRKIISRSKQLYKIGRSGRHLFYTIVLIVLLMALLFTTLQ